MIELLQNLLLGFSASVTPINLLLCLAGVLLGTLVGVLPGIGPATTIALLLPLTFDNQPVGALIMLAGIYCGAAQYGGSTTAVLVNMPGESSGVVTAIDGHQMACQGRAGAALAIAAFGSSFAGCVATFFIAGLAPGLAEIGLRFGPAENVALMLFGLVAAILLFCCMGAYSVANSTLDVVMLMLFGVLGYVLSRLDCEPAPLLLAFIIGPMFEENFRRAMLISRGDPEIFVARPVSLTLPGLAAALLLTMVIPAVRSRRQQVFID